MKYKPFPSLPIIENPEKLTNGCNRVEGYKRLAQYISVRRVCELGVREAIFSKQILFSLNRCGFVYGIDIEDCPNGRALQQQYPWGYEFIQSDSIVAAKKWPNEWFDFVYVDSCHKYNHVKREIEVWWPKLRQNGIMMFDDFMEYHCYTAEGAFGVMDAVLEFVKNNNLSLYMVGLDTNNTKQISDMGVYMGSQLRAKADGLPHKFIEPPNVYIQKR